MNLKHLINLIMKSSIILKEGQSVIKVSPLNFVRSERRIGNGVFIISKEEGKKFIPYEQDTYQFNHYEIVETFINEDFDIEYVILKNLNNGFREVLKVSDLSLDITEVKVMFCLKEEEVHDCVVSLHQTDKFSSKEFNILEV